MAEERKIFQKCELCGNWFDPAAAQCPYCEQATRHQSFEDTLPPARPRRAWRLSKTVTLLLAVGIFTALLVVLVLRAEVYSSIFAGRPTETPLPSPAPALVSSSTSTPAPTPTPTSVPDAKDKYVLWALYNGRYLRSIIGVLQENLESLNVSIEFELEFEKTMEKLGMGTRVPEEGEISFLDLLDINKKTTLYALASIDSVFSDLPELPRPMSLEEEHQVFLDTKLLLDEAVQSINKGYNILEQGELEDGIREFEKADQFIKRFEESVSGAMESISPSSIPYNDLFRYAEQYKGREVYYWGEVIQVIETGNYYQLRVNITATEYGWEDTVFLHYPDAPVRILEGDEISFVGRVNGVITYESAMGASVTIPELVAHSVLIESE